MARSAELFDPPRSTSTSRPHTPRATPVGERAIVQVRTEADIVRAILRARRTGGRVRAIGAGGSKNLNFATDGITLDLRRYDRVVAFDGNRVTVQAGMTVDRLNAVIRRHGLALPTQGEWNRARVAGAASTGTHGGSAHHGCFSTSLVAIRLVTGDGRIVTLERHDVEFRHAAVSLGLLGVISELTFACVDRFWLLLERRTVPFERYAFDLPRAARATEFHAAVWFPAAGGVITYTADRAGPGGRPTGRPLRYGLSTAVLHALSDRRAASWLLDSRAIDGASIGDCAEILSPLRASVRKVRLLRRLAPEVREVEFAVPLERGADALIELDRLSRARPDMHALPVGIRPTAADAFSLSPCTGRDVLWIATFVRNDDSVDAEFGALFGSHQARCHWGKSIALDAAHLRRQYPEWDAFAAARARFDPDGVLGNGFTRGLGLS